MTFREIIDFCLTLPNSYEDYPFAAMTGDDVWAVMRHTANKKSFALIYEKDNKLCINLKCDPLEAELLRGIFNDVTPGYHMNKTHWNTITIGGDVPEGEILRQIQHSYDLIKPKRKGDYR